METAAARRRRTPVLVRAALLFAAWAVSTALPRAALGQEPLPPLPPLPATSPPVPAASPGAATPAPAPIATADPSAAPAVPGEAPASVPAATADDEQEPFQKQVASPAGFGFPSPPSPSQLPDPDPMLAPPPGAKPAKPLDKVKAGYQADLYHRIALTGDWGGLRSSLVDDGLLFYGDATQFYFGVTAGGLRQRFRYYGHNDYVGLVIGEKLGLWKGFFVKFRGETRYGESAANTDSGTLLPPAINAALPVPNAQLTALTELLFIQAVGDRLLLQAGKLTTLDGDTLAFAGGRGKTQFSNSGFVFNPVFARTIPYDTLGAGFVVLSKGFNPLLAFSVLDPTQSPRTSGFPVFRNGVALSTAVTLPVKPFGLPGHQRFIGTYSSATYRGFEDDPRVLLTGGPALPPRKGSWALGYSFDQYLWQDPTDPKRGWGLFARLGISDGDPNPLQYYWSVGLGGTGPVATRPHDNWGVGFFNGGVKKGTVLDELLRLNSGWGVETYYNIALTGWARLTPDLQVLQGGLPRAETALIFGLRLQVVF